MPTCTLVICLLQQGYVNLSRKRELCIIVDTIILCIFDSIPVTLIPILMRGSCTLNGFVRLLMGFAGLRLST